MDYSDDIQEESPCFIVPDSQASVIDGKRCDRTTNGGLKELLAISCPRTTLTPALATEAVSKSTTDGGKLQGDIHKTNSPLDGSDQSSVEKGSSSSADTVYPNSSSDSSKEEYERSGCKFHPTKQTLIQKFRDDGTSSSQEDLFSTFPPQEVTGTSGATFECLQLSGEVREKETSSSGGVISPTCALSLKPTSPSTADEAEKEEVSRHLEETSLPKWQKDCADDEVSEKVSSMSSTETLSRSTFQNASSSEEPSLHQWQSPQNGSDELFEHEQNSNSTSSGGADRQVPDLQVPDLPDLQVPDLPDLQIPELLGEGEQSHRPKGLQLPELSEDIFHPKKKGTKVDTPSKRPEKISEPIPAENDVTSPSQEDDNAFRLHLTQSSSPSPPITRVPYKMGNDRQNESLSVMTSRLLSPEAKGDLHEAPLTTDDVAEQMTESTESVQEEFHFSPPTVLLKPTLTMPSPCFETSPESQEELLLDDDEQSPPEICCTSPEICCTSPEICCTSPEICCTSEFEPVLQEIVTNKTLSLSAPVPCDESSDEEANSPDVEFNLQKMDFVPDTERGKVKSPLAPVFTNVCERFQEPNEIRGSPPLRRISESKRKRENLEKLARKRTKSNEISESIELDESDSTESPKRKFWKVTRTKTTTTTTTVVEREMILKYTDMDGNVLVNETTHLLDEPMYNASAVESEETREEVEVIPGGENSTSNKASSCGGKENAGSGLNQRTSVWNGCKYKDLHKTNKRSLSAGRPPSRRKTPEVCEGSGDDLHEGSRVLALWFDKHFYPGTLRSRNMGDARCRIDFDDGNVRDIRECDILAVDCLPRDQPVMMREEHGQCYDNGVIRGFYRTRHEPGYKVAKEDGKVQNCPRSRVILNAEQAAIFLSLRSLSTNEPEPINSPTSSEGFTSPDLIYSVRSSPRTRSADRASTSKNSNACRASCSKIAKMSRTCDDGKGAKASRTSTTSSDKVATTSRASSDKDNEQKDARRLSSSETPKSSHKSTAKKGGTRNDNCGNEGEQRPLGKVRRRLSCAMQIEDKPRALPTRTSPRKCGKRSDVDETLVLPTDHDLFRGYGFVITGNNVTSVSHVDDDSPREEEHTFNRDHVRRQIESGGGVVLPSFNEDPDDNSSSLLLSNSCQTTAKYFHALVVGAPCLSHAWLRDCCSANKLVSYMNYLLPAGRDLVTESMVEEQKCTNALRDLKVHLVGDMDFIEQWKKVLGAAKCEIVDKMPTNVLKDLQYGNEDFNCDVIVVVSGHASHSTVRKARLLAVPTVTIHWVKQCILTGKRVAFDAHPSFRYTVQGKE